MNGTFTCNREVDFAIRWIADAEDLSGIIFIISKGNRCSHGQDCLVDPLNLLNLLNPLSGLLPQALAMTRAFKCARVAYKGIIRIQEILNLLPDFLSTLLHFHCLLELGYPVSPLSNAKRASQYTYRHHDFMGHDTYFNQALVLRAHVCEHSQSCFPLFLGNSRLSSIACIHSSTVPFPEHVIHETNNHLLHNLALHASSTTKSKYDVAKGEAHDMALVLGWLLAV